MVYKILQIYTSVRNDKASFSSRNTAWLAEKIRQKFPGSQTTIWDLAQHPVPYLTKDFFTAATTPLSFRSEPQNQLLDSVSMKPLLENDLYLIGMAGYMYDMPAVLKSLLEHTVQFDVTVNPDGSPRLKNKKAIIIAAWGDADSNIEPEIGYEAVLRKAFAYLGIKDITFFNIYRTDTLTADEDTVRQAMEKYLQSWK